MLQTRYIDSNHCHFSVWAPTKEKMSLHIVSPFDKEFDMVKDAEGNFSFTLEANQRPLKYFFRPDGEKDFPDPASQFQPDGVHGASQVVDHAEYQWNDSGWKGLPLEEYILCEIHTGAFTPEGTFEAIIPRLDELKETGINAIELMPVCQFPGARNWGYDGVFPYSVQNSYGGPAGLKKLVDACHQKGIAVILDVVYNHLGPEGNYFSHFAPYFTDRYKTPWGDAINYDGEWSDGVREFFSENMLYWFEYYHIDGLRCDAIHMVFDHGAVHFWEYSSKKVLELSQKLGRPLYLIAESDMNSPRVIFPPAEGGYGFSAQWLDDFHHALYVLLDPKGRERYIDFGKMSQLAKAYTDGFVHSGEWVEFRKRKHGSSSAGVAGNKFIIFNLNHDQAGNRVDGARLCMLVDFERVKIAAAAIMLAPYIPMLFMGEEYADDTPFYYFVSHSDPELIRAVQEGRKNEFKAFGFEKGTPDPQAEETFQKSKIRWEKRSEPEHKIILEWHKELIRMRKNFSALKNFNKSSVRVETIGEDGFVLMRQSADGKEKMCCLFNLSGKEISWKNSFLRNGKKILDSKESKWMISPDEKKISLPEEISFEQNFFLPPVSVTVYLAS